MLDPDPNRTADQLVQRRAILSDATWARNLDDQRDRTPQPELLHPLFDQCGSILSDQHDAHVGHLQRFVKRSINLVTRLDGLTAYADQGKPLHGLWMTYYQHLHS
jgi:hypothetical protein